MKMFSITRIGGLQSSPQPFQVPTLLRFHPMVSGLPVDDSESLPGKHNEPTVASQSSPIISASVQAEPEPNSLNFIESSETTKLPEPKRPLVCSCHSEVDSSEMASVPRACKRRARTVHHWRSVKTKRAVSRLLKLATLPNDRVELVDRSCLRVGIRGESVRGQLDKRVGISWLGCDATQRLDRLNLKMNPLASTIQTADGTVHQVVGSLAVSVEAYERIRRIRLFVVPTFGHELVLGTDFCRTFGVSLKETSPPVPSDCEI